MYIGTYVLNMSTISISTSTTCGTLRVKIVVYNNNFPLVMLLCGEQAAERFEKELRN